MHNHMYFFCIPERTEDESGNWGPGTTPYSLSLFCCDNSTASTPTLCGESEPWSERRPTIFRHGRGKREEMVGQL